MIRELENQKVWNEPFVGLLFGSFLCERLGPVHETMMKSSNFIMDNQHREVWLRSIRNFVLDGAAARHPELKREQHLFIKEPNGSIGAALIMAAMPESKMVFLIRDSRDVVASQLDTNRKGGWGEESGVKNRWEYDTPEKLYEYTRHMAENYLKEVSQSKRAYEEHNGKKAFVRYEDLRRDPYNILRDMYQALEVEVDERQLKAAIEKHSWERIPQDAKGSGTIPYRPHLGTVP